ncbi:hypothetical protein MZK49_08060 [Ensifer sesbaniae]|uniref:hypothetical protein n=1 Tax=Ensifer sesbaniae TaxID=1214071 RepID=UPI002001C731|nr:hypothetical protein [Ensifer sesbaniae]
MSIEVLIKRAADWYEGKYVSYENDPHSRVFIVGGYYERHWTARVARTLVEFWLAHWQWTIGTMLALLGLYVTLIKG